MLRSAAFVIALTLFAGAPAFAQDVTPDSENGRYTFKETADELLRLDGRTGQVSSCSKRPAGWACVPAPDERAALEAEISRLQTQNAALKKELVSRGIALPSGIGPSNGAASKSNEIVITLPRDVDLDRAKGFLEEAWRRLRDLVDAMQRDVGKKG